MHRDRFLSLRFCPPLLLVLLAACQTPVRKFQPDQDPATLDDTAFLHYLPTVPVVTVDEGMRAVLLLEGPTTQWPTHEQRRAALEQRGAVLPSWRLESDRILDKGTLAYMLRVRCRVPRSVGDVLGDGLRLGDRRSAMKTCIDAGLLPYGTEYEPVTGGELLSALTRAESRVQGSDGP